jgi:hypothetical protein
MDGTTNRCAALTLIPWVVGSAVGAAACGSPSSASTKHGTGASTGSGAASGSGTGMGGGSAPSATAGNGGGTPGGLAAQHCGDVGIETDPSVVFVEKFDEGSITAASTRWDGSDNPQAMSISAMVPPGSGAKTSAKWHYESTDAFTVGFLKNLSGYDQLWFRYYVNLAPAGDPIWHFFRMGGGSPYGGANQKPDGTDRFVSSVEPNYTRQKWDFYTYWVDMRPDSSNSYYGNNFLGEDFPPCKDLAPAVATGAWVAVEMMMKMNTVGKYDGEQAFWINGQPLTSNYAGGATPEVVSTFGPGTPKGSWITAHFCPDTTGQPFDGASGTPGNGFRWRTVPTLDISYIRPLVYNDHAQPNPSNDAYVANIVVATKPIGPIVACP